VASAGQAVMVQTDACGGIILTGNQWMKLKSLLEQRSSAGNKDYLKLGQILGADWLLLMEIV